MNTSKLLQYGKKSTNDQTAEQMREILHNEKQRIEENRSVTVHVNYPVEKQDNPKNDAIEDENENTICDFYYWTPRIFQEYRKKWIMLAIVSWSAFSLSMLVSGFMRANLASLQRRYKLSSADCIFYLFIQDFSAALCTLPVAYYGAQMRRLRIVSGGMFLIGSGALVMLLPHLGSGHYTYEAPVSSHCSREANVSSTAVCANRVSNGLKSFRFLFWFGSFIVGIGASPVHVLSVTYLDDNTPRKVSPVFLGAFSAFFAIGRGVGFSLSGVFMKIFVNVGRAPTGATVADKHTWVGAWWIGFVLSAAMVMVPVPFLFSFPKELPGIAKLRAKKRVEAYARSEELCQNWVTDLAHLGGHVKIILRNPTFVFLAISKVNSYIIIDLLSNLGPKYLEQNFGYSVDSTYRIFGVVLVIFSLTGSVLCGFIIAILNVPLKVLLRVQAFLSVLLLPMLILTMFITCGTFEKDRWAGITAPYENDSDLTLEHRCNSDCHCNSHLPLFSPICGMDNQTYFSPCYAGCSLSATKALVNCTCIKIPDNITPFSQQPAALSAGPCRQVCHNAPFFCLFFGLYAFLFYATDVMTTVTTLRCVPHKEKSLAFGITLILTRVFGNFPTPIVIVAIVDYACVFQTSTCANTKECLLYNSKRLRYAVWYLGFAPQCFMSASLFASWLFYKSPPHGEEESTDQSSLVVRRSDIYRMSLIYNDPDAERARKVVKRTSSKQYGKKRPSRQLYRTRSSQTRNKSVFGVPANKRQKIFERTHSPHGRGRKRVSKKANDPSHGGLRSISLEMDTPQYVPRRKRLARTRTAPQLRAKENERSSESKARKAKRRRRKKGSAINDSTDEDECGRHLLQGSSSD